MALVYHAPVRIGQLLLPGVSAYERKCQKVDLTAIRHDAGIDVVDWNDPTADLVHVYGPDPLPAVPVREIRGPYIASARPAASRLPWRRAPDPALLADPVTLPEAVEEHYFSPHGQRNVVHFRGPNHLAIGSFVGGRPGITSMVERTLTRIHRFRDDVEWKTFDIPPAPAEIAALDLWVDPAVDANDLDGFTAEAMVAGTLVVASRTPQNQVRLAGGAAGFLVPLNDPNELTHAIAAALFKEELSASRRERAAELADRFRPQHRAAALLAIYQKAVR